MGDVEPWRCNTSDTESEYSEISLPSCERRSKKKADKKVRKKVKIFNVVGQRGPKGEEGERGKCGLRGKDGPTGQTGPTGPPGTLILPPTASLTTDEFVGLVGQLANNPPTPGQQGPVGDKGPLGDKGPVGDKGPEGDKGAPGDPGQPGEGTSFKGQVTTPVVTFLGPNDNPTLYGPSQLVSLDNGYMNIVRADSPGVYDLFSLEMGLVPGPPPVGGMVNQFRLSGKIGPLRLTVNPNYPTGDLFYGFFCLDVSNILSSTTPPSNEILSTIAGRGLIGRATFNVDPLVINNATALPTASVGMTLNNISNPNVIYFIVSGTRTGAEVDYPFEINFNVIFIGIDGIY